MIRHLPPCLSMDQLSPTFCIDVRNAQVIPYTINPFTRITCSQADDTHGGVQPHDEVIGHGYYNFIYTIRAEDDEGNISDLTFSGDAHSICVSQLSVT
jgi:hypothetical protein